MMRILLKSLLQLGTELEPVVQENPEADKRESGDLL